MESTVLKEIRAAGRAEGRIEGHANALADQLRHRLGVNEVVESLVKRLSACSDATLRQISFLIMDESNENLVAAVQRLLPKE